MLGYECLHYLSVPKAARGVLEITMLRPLEWLDAHNVVVGGSVALNMPELGAQGNARVLGVYPCPEIKPGPGQVITATFAHPSTFQVLDVTIGEGEDAETIGVTDNHPFWSETHQAFVPVGQLSVGDELLTLHGQKKRLTALLPRPSPPERVYNLEVHGEHTYYVGHQQLLVHNNYPQILTNADILDTDFVNSNRRLFESTESGTGVAFSGAYNVSNGKFSALRSGTTTVPRNGGHMNAFSELGMLDESADFANCVGFTLFRTGRGEAYVAWKSGGLNNRYLGDRVPEEMRRQIKEVLQRDLGIMIQDLGNFATPLW